MNTTTTNLKKNHGQSLPVHHRRLCRRFYTESIAPHIAAIDAAHIAFQKAYNAALLTASPETRESVVHQLWESCKDTTGRHFAAIDVLRRSASLAGVK